MQQHTVFRACEYKYILELLGEIAFDSDNMFVFTGGIEVRCGGVGTRLNVPSRPAPPQSAPDLLRCRTRRHRADVLWLDRRGVIVTLATRRARCRRCGGGVPTIVK